VLAVVVVVVATVVEMGGWGYDGGASI